MAQLNASTSQRGERIPVSTVASRLDDSPSCSRMHSMNTTSTSKTGRSRDDLYRHYEIERELADQLRAAPPELRKELYRTVYNELFRRVPDHPQLTRKHDAAL